eukprot:2229686-Prymnesium_polylepis.1
MRRPTSAGSALGRPSTVASSPTTGRGAGAGAGGAGMSGTARRAAASMSSRLASRSGQPRDVLAARAP